MNDRAARSLPPTPTIVLTSAVAWDGVFARPHHLSWLLAMRGWNVLFVDGPVTWIGPLKNPELRSRLWPTHPVREVPLTETAQANANAADDAHPRPLGSLRILSPIACLPFANQRRAVNRFNQRLLALQIRGAAAAPYVLFSMLPNSVDLARRLPAYASIYDCVDLHEEFPGFVNKRKVQQMEREMAKSSKAVFATADSLLARMRTYQPRAMLVPNAGETEHFATTATAPLHPLLANIPVPRALFIGGIGPWLDLALLADFARNRPNAQLVLVGPQETDVSLLQSLANVHFLGRQPYAELPQFLAGAAATLVPFRVDSAVAQSVNPVKVYEYLAADREVIATPIAEMVKMRNAVWLTESGDAAAAAWDAILAGKRRLPDASERLQLVADNSWAARANIVEQALRQAVVDAGLSAPQPLP